MSKRWTPCQGTRKRLLVSCAGAAGFAVLALSQFSPAWAVPFDGNVMVQSPVPNGVGGTINYAVFQISPTNLSMFTSLPFVRGAGSGPLDTALGTWVYLYQPANTGANKVEISHLSQSLGFDGSPTSWGYAHNEVFVDGNTHVNATHALTSGVSPTFAPAAPGDMALDPAAFSGPGCDSTPGNGVHISGAGLLADYCSGSVGSLTNLAAGDTSTIVAFTSKVGPTFASGSLQSSNGTSVDGADPAPAPEPSSMLLSSIGFLALAGSWARGRVLGVRA